MALKLDMSKAYDKMEWRFMEGVLNLMGFPVSLVNLIMKCISSISYQFLLNDQTSRKFYPGRGLCQGDPLSPYSFVMCAYFLSGKLKMGTYKNQIHGIQVFRRAPKISHLFFADDCLLFSKANTDEADKILEILHRYQASSDQMVIIKMFEVSFSLNVLDTVINMICSKMGVKIMQYHLIYLGLRIFSVDPKKYVFISVINLCVRS